MNQVPKSSKKTPPALTTSQPEVKPSHSNQPPCASCPPVR